MGEPVSMIDYDRFSDDREFTFQVNEVKKAWKREQPKVYRNGTGKRTKIIKSLHTFDCDEQSALEEDQNAV